MRLYKNIGDDNEIKRNGTHPLASHILTRDFEIRQKFYNSGISCLKKGSED